MNISNHIEKYFGKISRGWHFTDEENSPYQIVECRNGLIPDVVSFCTLGLCKFDFISRKSNKKIKHEIILSFDKDHIPKNAVAIVKQMAEEAVCSKNAYMENQIVKRPGFLFEETFFSGLIIKPPVFFGEGSFVYKGEDTGNVSCIFAWLIPLFESEIEFIKLHGVDEFENILEESKIDLFLTTRKSVVPYIK